MSGGHGLVGEGSWVAAHLRNSIYQDYVRDAVLNTIIIAKIGIMLNRLKF